MRAWDKSLKAQGILDHRMIRDAQQHNRLRLNVRCVTAPPLPAAFASLQVNGPAAGRGGPRTWHTVGLCSRPRSKMRRCSICRMKQMGRIASAPVSGLHSSAAARTSSRRLFPKRNTTRHLGLKLCGEVSASSLHPPRMREARCVWTPPACRASLQSYIASAETSGVLVKARSARSFRVSGLNSPCLAQPRMKSARRSRSRSMSA